MLDHLLQRYSDNGESSLSLFMLREPTGLRFLCYTLEDEARAVKVKGETRIDPGIYDLVLRQELTPLTKQYRDRFPSWFSWHVEIVGLPRHKDVYIHIGNKDDDSDACLLLGDNVNNNRWADGFIGDSVTAYRRWYTSVVPRMALSEPARIEIRDENRLR